MAQEFGSISFAARRQLHRGSNKILAHCQIWKRGAQGDSVRDKTLLSYSEVNIVGPK